MPRIFSGKVIFYLLLVLALDMGVLARLNVWFLGPVLLWMMVPYAAFAWHWEKTVPLAFLAGLLRDLTGSLPFGVESTSLVLSALVLDFVAQKVEREIFLLRLGLVFLFVLLNSFLILNLATWLGSAPPAGGYAFATSWKMAFSSLVMMPVFFRMTARFFHDRQFSKQYELFG